MYKEKKLILFSIFLPINFKMFENSCSASFSKSCGESSNEMNTFFKLTFFKHMNCLISNFSTSICNFLFDIRNQIHIRKIFLKQTILRNYKNLFNQILGIICNFKFKAKFQIIFKEVIAKFLGSIRKNNDKHFRIPNFCTEFFSDFGKCSIKEFSVKKRFRFYVVFLFHVKLFNYLLSNIFNCISKYNKMFLIRKYIYINFSIKFSTNVDRFFYNVGFVRI